MDRRVHSGILAASTILAALVAAPAAAAPEGSPFSPDMITAVQRDLGLTADQAVARLTVEQDASETNSVLRKDLGASYAGGWMSDGRLVVGVTDQAAAAEVRAEGAEPKLVARSEAALEAERAKLDAHKARAPKSMASWYVDVTTNTVVVNSPSVTDALRYVASTGAAAVRVVASTESPRPFIDVVRRRRLLHRRRHPLFGRVLGERRLRDGRALRPHRAPPRPSRAASSPGPASRATTTRGCGSTPATPRSAR